MATATATVVFCDVVDSTVVRTRIGEAAADTLFIDHARLLTGVVERHGGRVLKTAGDGIMAAFTSASDAVTAAGEMQRAVTRRSPELRIRVGIAAGDVSWEGDDCFGLPVVTAARLEAAAAGGQILVNQVVRWLASERSGASFEPLGELELKGLPGPVEAFAVPWEGDPAGSPEPVPFPPALAMPSEFAFVGRDDEWATLERLWSAVVAGEPRVALLGGEAGAGKTRLAAEFARRCCSDGAAVLLGGCDAQLAVPYQPWVQALEQLLRVLKPEELADETTADLTALAALVPSLDRVLATRAGRTVIDADTERFRLFSAVEAVLAEASARWPVVLVLDDLHWAGAQTLGLLTRIARAGATGRMLVIGTFRDTGDEITEPLAGVLADLRRVDGVTRVRVGGLDGQGVAAFVADAVGRPLDSDLRRVADALAERSRGNTFFVVELWRHLLESGVLEHTGGHWVVRGSLDAAGVPESVREVVADRLARLAFPVRRLAELVAVAGPRVSVQVLRHAADLSAPDLASGLDELVTADLLEAVERPQLTYRFTHALVRETVESKIPPAARAHLHLRVAEALETVHEVDRRPVLAELAGHYRAAASLGMTPKAVYYTRQAAEQAMRSLAFDEAIVHLRAVLDLTGDHTAARAEALIDIGWTDSKRSRFEDSMAAYDEGFRLAVELGEHHLAAEAAIGFEDAIHTPGLPGEPAVALVTRAIALSETLAPAVRARLQAALSRALTHAGRLDEAEETLQTALALAREAGHPDALAAALESALILTTDPVAMLEYAAQLDAIGSDIDDPWRIAYSTINQLRAHTMLGQLDRAAAALERHWGLGRVGRFLLVQIQALSFELTLALAAGRFDDAEAAAEKALAYGDDVQGNFASGVYGLQMFVIRRAQGRLAEVRPILETVSRRSDGEGVWRPGLAVLYAELGMLDEARREIDVLSQDGFASIPRDTVWPGCVSFLADACVATGAVEHATVLYDEMLPLRGHNVMVGMTVSVGPADRPLGALAALLGRDDDARAHFEAALALAERSQSPVWRAHVLHDWARSAAYAGDAAGAAERAAAALADAESVGMPTLAERCREILRSPRLRVVADAPFPNGLSGREVDVLRLIAAGCSNREIGEKLHISPNTAANHVRAILQKTATANRAEAVTYAARRGLLD